MSREFTGITIIGVIGRAERIGGAEGAFLTLMEGFQQILGADVQVATHLASSHSDARFGVTVLRPDGRRPGPRMVWRLRQLIAVAPDGTILFPFQIRSNIITSLANALLPRDRRLPIVVNDRANIDAMLTPLRPGIVGVLKARSFRALTRTCYRRASYIVCNSVGNAERVRAFLGQPSPPVSTILNPIDAKGIQSRFRPRDRSKLISARNPLITAHGRLDNAQKGWDALLAAFARIRAVKPEARLRIVGDGPDRPALQAMAARLGVAIACEWPGHLVDPLPAIEAGDVYAFPSRWEGLPNALLEAVALGLPVVATDCPTGPAEILSTPKPCGYLVPVDAVDQLAEGLLSLLAYGETRATLSARARDRANDFSLEVAVAAYAKIFREIRARRQA